jgi:hypothetical protein
MREAISTDSLRNEIQVYSSCVHIWFGAEGVGGWKMVRWEGEVTARA